MTAPFEYRKLIDGIRGDHTGWGWQYNAHTLEIAGILRYTETEYGTRHVRFSDGRCAAEFPVSSVEVRPHEVSISLSCGIQVVVPEP